MSQHITQSARQRAPLRQEQYRRLSESLELPFRVNANWYLKFCGVIFTFVAIAVIVKFALLSNVTSVSVEPAELAVNPKRRLAQCSHCLLWHGSISLCMGGEMDSERKIKREKEVKRQNGERVLGGAQDRKCITYFQASLCLQAFILNTYVSEWLQLTGSTPHTELRTSESLLSSW